MQNPTAPAFAQQLDLVEQQFNQVAAHLAAGDALALQSASGMLQDLSVELARLLTNVGPATASPANSKTSKSFQAAPKNTSQLYEKAVRQRVRVLAASMQSLRDNLSRQAAFNQQALAVLVPTPTKSTYSGGSSVYGAVARQAGVHKYLAA